MLYTSVYHESCAVVCPHARAPAKFCGWKRTWTLALVMTLLLAAGEKVLARPGFDRCVLEHVLCQLQHSSSTVNPFDAYATFGTVSVQSLVQLDTTGVTQ